MKPTNPVTHENISQRAHQIWEQAGRPEFSESDHWLQAERELHGQQAAESGGSAPSRSVEPLATGKHASKKVPHSADYVHPGVTTDSLHHHRKG